MAKVQDFTYHCHTNFSDGNNSIEEMAVRAKALGFSHFGISDHLIVHKNLRQSPSYAWWKTGEHSDMYASDFKQILSKYQRHCDDIHNLGKKMNMKILVGFEVDFFTYDGWLEEFREFVSQLDCDYLINGNHMLFNEDCSIFFDSYDLEKVSVSRIQTQEYISRHFSAMCEAVKSEMFDFIAHIDYIKRYCSKFYTYSNYEKQINSLLDEMAKHDIGTELSTKGLRKIGCYYPCEQILNQIAQRNLKTVISDDAHDVSELGTFFAEAEHLLLQYNISNRINFESVDKK